MLEWVPTGVGTIGLLAGPLVVLGYLAGSVPFTYLSSRRRLRRQLDQPSMGHLLEPDGPGSGTGDRLSAHRVGAWILPAMAALAATTLAWHVSLAATPGASNFSAVGIFSNQAVGAWVSVALWTGLAAVVGHVAPVWTGFRGGSGLPPAIALCAAYIPVVLLVATGVALATYALTRRPRTSLVCTLATLVVVAYVAWLGDLQGGWGINNGPETTLWTAVLAATLFARNLRADWGDVPESP